MQKQRKTLEQNSEHVASKQLATQSSSKRAPQSDSYSNVFNSPDIQILSTTPLQLSIRSQLGHELRKTMNKMDGVRHSEDQGAGLGASRREA